jgi:hypothetical protein
VIALPAYFHQQDDVDAQIAKGINQLRVEVDMAVARDTHESPLLEALPVPLGSELQVLARKAMSGVTATLARTASLLAAPPSSFVPDKPSAADEVKLVIATSVVGERYGLWRGAEQLGQREGNGAALEFELGVLGKTTSFVLALERSDEQHLPLERRITLTIEVV